MAEISFIPRGSLVWVQGPFSTRAPELAQILDGQGLGRYVDNAVPVQMMPDNVYGTLQSALEGARGKRKAYEEALDDQLERALEGLARELRVRPEVLAF